MATITAWSYSRYVDYKTCPLLFKLRHIDRIKGGAESPAMKRGGEIHTLAEKLVSTPAVRKLGKPAPAVVVPPELGNFEREFMQLVELAHTPRVEVLVEQECGFDNKWQWLGPQGWFDRNTWFRSKWDVYVGYDDNTADLIDHKTGRKYGTNEEQVELFGASAFMRFPKLDKVTTRLWYLDIPDGPNDGDPNPQSTANEVVREYTRSEADKIMRDWERKVKPMFTEQKYVARPNDKCKWCDFSKAKGGPCKF